MSWDLKIVSGDLVLKNGKLDIVQDSAKLIQDILKILLTAAGSNPLQSWYGSFLSRTIIGNPNNDPGMLIQIAKSQIETALTNLQNLQKLQLQSFQRMSADEQLSAILGISVTQSQVNPTLFMIKIKVMTAGLRSVDTSFVVNTLT
jgi:phage baseplate assembly protein W